VYWITWCGILPWLLIGQDSILSLNFAPFKSNREQWIPGHRA
jgi:hypothetical protein